MADDKKSPHFNPITLVASESSRSFSVLESHRRLANHGVRPAVERQSSIDDIWERQRASLRASMDDDVAEPGAYVVDFSHRGAADEHDLIDPTDPGDDDDDAEEATTTPAATTTPQPTTLPSPILRRPQNEVPLVPVDAQVVPTGGLEGTLENGGSRTGAGMPATRRKYIVTSLCGGLFCVTVAGVVIGVCAAVLGGHDDDPNIPLPMTTPTASPTTVFPVTSEPVRCFGDSRSLTDALLARRDHTAFTDLQICPQTTERVILTYPDDPTEGVTPGLLVQSNVRIKCGPDGKLEDQCVFQGRGQDYFVLNSPESFGEFAARNVSVEGFTFQGAQNSFLQMENAGDVTFRNCLFRESPGFAPIVIDYYDDNSSNTTGSEESTSRTQTVTFDGCIFEDLHFGPALRFSSISTVVLATGPANTVILRNCIFRNNYDTTNDEVRVTRQLCVSIFFF